MAFTKKIIEIRIQLIKGEFSNHTDTIIIRDLPSQVDIGKAGLPARDTAKINLYGLRQEDLEALTFLNFRTLQVNYNKIAVFAGDEATGMSLAYSGEIINSAPNYNSAPDVYLDIDALSGYYSGMLAVPPYTFKGSIPASTILSDLCKQMGYTFINEGCTKAVLNPYLKGSPIQKIIQLAKDYKLDLTLSDETVRLRKDEGTRKVRAVLADNSSLIGYPEFSSNGIRCRSEFLPQLEIGDWVEVQSIVPKASGIWSVISTHSSIGVLMDNAPWRTEIEAVYVAGN